jgi:ABC-type branched-subunit amino acid transport system substrate-binding protein
VGTRSLLGELGDAGEGVIISQVVPAPQVESVPVVKEYAAAMKKYQPDQEADWVSLEGYLAAKLFCQVAEKAGKDLTRESFLATVDNTGSFDLGGFPLKFGPDNHQGSDAVFLTVIQGGRATAVP